MTHFLKNLSYVFCVSFIGLSACQEKMVVIPEYDPPITEKVILIEELTGVICSQCPAGSAALEKIIEQNQGKVIGVGIHGALLSDPINDDSKDLRNQVAIDIENSFDFLGKPAAIINRVRFSDQSFIGINSPSTWADYVTQEFLRDAELLVTPIIAYDEDTRTIQLEVIAKALTDLEGTYNISVMLTQSQIVTPQYYPDHTDYEYVHNHVLRDMLTGTFGDPAFTQLSFDGVKSFNYTYTLPEDDGVTPDWVAEDLEIIAFISNVDTEDSRVIQASTNHVIE